MNNQTEIKKSVLYTPKELEETYGLHPIDWYGLSLAIYGKEKERFIFKRVDDKGNMPKTGKAEYRKLDLTYTSESVVDTSRYFIDHDAVFDLSSAE